LTPCQLDSLEEDTAKCLTYPSFVGRFVHGKRGFVGLESKSKEDL
jgi:hypothetical protein